MEKNMKDLENKLKALEKKMSNKDYKAKVPQNVQDQDAEKCESFKIEIQESKKAIESITSLLQILQTCGDVRKPVVTCVTKCHMSQFGVNII